MAKDVRQATKAEGEWVPANPSNEADPVGRCGPTDWGFWDETWAYWHGGFADEAAAREGLKEYCAHL